jgi:hypothetical protein
MRLAARLVCGALTLVACGGASDKQSDADGVRATLAAFGEASAKHDYRRVCAELVAKPVIDSVRRAGLSCESAMKTALEGVQAPKIEVRQVTITGNRASAKVTPPPPTSPPQTTPSRWSRRVATGRSECLRGARCSARATGSRGGVPAWFARVSQHLSPPARGGVRV